MSASRESRGAAAAVQSGLALLSLMTGTTIAALLHSAAWSTPPATLGLVGYVVFAARAMRAWHGPGVPCIHFPPCWPGRRAARRRAEIG